ncbi:MAG: hypothetical protein IKZ99_08420 [Salinivirgaceae bacterium]|nr:hypothetical protein [Salinivirgaceae bacterium]
MLKFRIRLAFIAFASFLTMQNLCAQTADSLFVSGITDGTGRDTLINTLGVVSDTTVRDSLALADTVRTDSVAPKPVRDTSRYCLYRKVFIDKDSLKIHKWRYNPNTYDFDMSTYDSSLYMLNLHRPANYEGRVTSYLHQLGTAVNSHEFFAPNEPTRFLFLQSFTPYMHQAETEEFYNVKKPFTLFGYDGGMKDEQIVHLLHTQNVTRGLNLFFKYDSYGGDGEFVEQKTKNNAGSLGASFIQGRLATHAAWTFTRINVEENGGVTDDYFITDSVMNPKEIAVRLTDAKTYIKDRQWFIDQKVGFVRAKESDTVDTGGYWFSLQYTFKRQFSRKYYVDANKKYFNAITKDSLPVYAHNYSGRATYDSCSYSDQIHQIRLNLEEIKNPYAPFGLYGALGLHKARYYYFNVDTLFANTRSTTKTSGYVEAGLYRTRSGLLTFSGSYRQYYAGYKMGDFTLKGEVTQRFSKGEKPVSVSANVLFEQSKPDCFITDYQSNHFKWRKDFSKRPITAKISAQLDIPGFRTTVAGNYALLSNYIYLNTSCNPEQANSAVSVADIQLRNHLSGAGFNLVSRINYQTTSDSRILPLATLTAYEVLYYERELHFEATNGRLFFQLGLDMSFWTKYNAPAYCPATALFHNQDDVEIGNYPFVGAFLNVRIKQVRFFICGHHINYDLFGDREFFLAPHYPTSKVSFSYGIRWPFYD